MRKLFIPLLVVLALPTAVNAETWYLFASHARGIHTIPTVSKEACQISGEIFWDKKGNNWTGFKPSSPRYIIYKREISEKV